MLHGGGSFFRSAVCLLFHVKQTGTDDINRRDGVVRREIDARDLRGWPWYASDPVWAADRAPAELFHRGSRAWPTRTQ